MIRKAEKDFLLLSRCLFTEMCTESPTHVSCGMLCRFDSEVFLKVQVNHYLCFDLRGSEISSFSVHRIPTRMLSPQGCYLGPSPSSLTVLVLSCESASCEVLGPMHRPGSFQKWPNTLVGLCDWQCLES